MDYFDRPILFNLEYNQSGFDLDSIRKYLRRFEAAINFDKWLYDEGNQKKLINHMGLILLPKQAFLDFLAMEGIKYEIK